MSSQVKVLLISGSLRDGSVNTSVLRTAALLGGERWTATLYRGLDRLPHFNPDDDTDDLGLPAAVADLRKVLREFDGVMFCTPEYAGALPGSFKNLLDWTVGGGETYRKPVAWINASSRLVPDAAAGAHQSLRSVLTYTGTDIVETACRRIVVARSNLGSDGIIEDSSIRAEIAGALEALAAHIIRAEARAESPPS